MLQIATYGNTRFNIQLAAEYHSSDRANKCRNCFVLRYTLFDIADKPMNIIIDLDSLAEAVRQYGVIMKRYEPESIYLPVVESIMAQHLGNAEALMAQHEANMSDQEQDMYATDQWNQLCEEFTA